MDAMDAIYSRQSVREYLDRPVDQETIERILSAGISAPSAHNQQLCHFIVITERETLNGVVEVHPHAKMLLQAPVAICVCADHTLEKDPEAQYWIQDCAAATENILLAAHALGLGACWVGIHPRLNRKQVLGKMLHLPDHVSPFSLIALGHVQEQKPKKPRSLQSRLHMGHW